MVLDITNSYSLVLCLFLLRGHDTRLLGVNNSFCLLHCPAEAQQVRKCIGVRNLKQLFVVEFPTRYVHL